MKKCREEVLKILEANREAIRSFGVQSLGLFGSCARGQETETSDLDFVVKLEKNSFDSYMDLKDFLERLFGCQIDLVLADSIKPRIRTKILEEAIHAQGF
jgi:uncharacterized protein